MLKPALLLLFFVISVGFAHADESTNKIYVPEDNKDKFVEQDIPFPAYPDDANLLAFPIDARGTNYQYKMDLKSLRVDADGVTRYTMVIESPSGARNVIYEGIRCITNEYKTYAYGTASSEFQKNSTARWKRANDRGGINYQADLAENFLCDPEGSNIRADIVKERLRYGGGNPSAIFF